MYKQIQILIFLVMLTFLVSRAIVTFVIEPKNPVKGWGYVIVIFIGTLSLISVTVYLLDKYINK